MLALVRRPEGSTLTLPVTQQGADRCHGVPGCASGRSPAAAISPARQLNLYLRQCAERTPQHPPPTSPAIGPRPQQGQGPTRSTGPRMLGGRPLWAKVDHIGVEAGVAAWVIGEHHRGGGAGLVDDVRDLEVAGSFAVAGGRGADLHRTERQRQHA